MSTPGETDDGQPALDQQADQNGANVPVTKPPRTIRAFFGGQRSTPPVPNDAPTSSKPENTAKRRRKNTEKQIGPGQGRILLNVPGSNSWSVGRRDEDGDTESVASAAPSTSSGTANGKGKAAPKAKQGGGGEEEEMREMDRKVKATRGRSNATRGKRGRKGGTAEGGRIQQLDMKADEESEHTLSSPRDSSSFDNEAYQPSPGKNRGRQRKPNVKPNGSGNGSRKTTRSTSTVRDQSPDIHIIRSSSPNDVEITGHINGVSRPTALSRIKTTSNSSLKGASHQDPIDLEAAQTSLKPGPKRHVFASDLKPAHSFFSRNNPVTSSRATSVASDKSGPGDSKQEDQTTLPEPSALQPELPVTASTADTAPLQTTKKPVHNFFQPAGAVAKPGILKNGWGQGVKEGEEWSAPWPGSTYSGWPVHEGGPIEPIIAGPSMTKRNYTPQTIDDESTFWHSVLRGASTNPSSVPISRDKGKQRAPAAPLGDRETFAERFRPKQATQVLGNVTESTYLRDWLSALSVGTHESNGPKVIRRVAKARRTVDDWIVDDIGLYGLAEEEGDLDEIPEPLEEPDIPIGQRPQSYPPLSARLTNSILLTGPSGSGKSAAVYAAATELGWEVFEVYPGIGKRTGGNLMSLVGDVGKNHMVGKAKEVEETPASVPVPTIAGIQSFFKPKVGGGEVPLTGSQGEPIEVDDDHPDRPLTPPPRLRTSSANLTPFRDETKFRQSLILIEEVDILFEEEASFWPAVVSLIAESRRPVIMTCNGIDNVAIGSLPLQAILQFQPPSRNQAIDYLASLCTKLDIQCEDPMAYMTDLYNRSIVTSSDLIAKPGPPNGNEWLPRFDLRKAIMQLQLERGHCSATDRSITDPPAPEADLNDLARRIDMLSYTDAHLNPKSWAIMEVNELDRYAPNLDDRLGTRTIVKPELPDHIPVLPAYDHTLEISSYLTNELGLGLGRYPAHSNLLTDQIYHIRSLLPLLDPIIPLSSHLLPHPCLFIDYMPIIQTLIQIDDIRHAAYQVAKAGGEDVRNFKTGRPMRVTAWLGQDGFSRHLDLEPDALEVGRRSLRCWD